MEWCRRVLGTVDYLAGHKLPVLCHSKHDMIVGTGPPAASTKIVLFNENMAHFGSIFIFFIFAT